MHPIQQKLKEVREWRKQVQANPMGIYPQNFINDGTNAASQKKYPREIKAPHYPIEDSVRKR